MLRIVQRDRKRKHGGVSDDSRRKRVKRTALFTLYTYGMDEFSHSRSNRNSHIG